MEKKEIKIEPLEDKVTTNVVTYGEKSKNCLVVETVASYYNFFNWVNTPTIKTREYKEKFLDFNGVEQEREIVEKEFVNYDFSNNPMINLIFSQTIKIIINGEEKTPKTKEDLARFFSTYPEYVEKIISDIKRYSSYWYEGSDKGLAKKN